MMVVEDDRDTAEMLAAYFEAQGYEVIPVAWGADAVQQAQEGAAPDLILLDIRLPDMDGFEVCKRLRSHRHTQYVPIIFLTERRERGDRLSGLELGAVDYITKPFDVQDLRLRVRNILRRAKYQTLVHPVTGLPNQEQVAERLAALPKQRDWALLTLQVSGLDEFADRYGFVARDETLRALALLMNNSVSEGQSDPDSSFVGQSDDDSFVIIVEAGRAAELRDRLIARLRQSLNFFYPAKERTPTDERPRLTLALGLITAQNGPYADDEAIREASLNALRPLA
jgi:DNA-binding response OmpR family regulator